MADLNPIQTLNEPQSTEREKNQRINLLIRKAALLVSNLAGVSANISAVSAATARNRIINPLGQFTQAGLASTADAAYTGFDQWYALTQSGAITPSQLTNVENGTPFMMRLTQAQVTAQRFGIVQPLESVRVGDMRAKAISVRFRARMSASTTLRWAVVEWNGTADSLTKDIVNDWTSAAYTTGNFFISSSVTVVGTGSLALAANTLTDCISNSIGTVSGSMNNLYLFIWTDSAQAQNMTLDIGNVWVGQNANAPATFEPPSAEEDFLRSLRYFYAPIQSGDTRFLTIIGTVSVANAAVGLSCLFRTPMRTIPTMNNPATKQLYVSGVSFTVAVSAISTNSNSATLEALYFACTISSSAPVGALAYWTGSPLFFDARL